MDKNPSKKKQSVKLVFVYVFMMVAIILAVVVATLFLLGYRFNLSTYNIEQHALLQFSSSPSGASVSIDNNTIFAQTPNKSIVEPGVHEIAIWKDGYQTWTKTVNAKVSNLSLPSYALLVPKNLSVEPVIKYDSIFASLASPSQKRILLQEATGSTTLKLVDVSSDDIKSSDVVLPTTILSKINDAGVTHAIQLVKWDNGDRYVLAKHLYGENVEWLVIDTQDVQLSKNITTTFNVAIDSADFDGTGGNKFYILTSGIIRTLNLSDGTISRTLVNNVKDFSFHEDLNTAVYHGTNGSTEDPKQVVGIYRSGDANPSIIQTIDNTNAKIRVTAGTYISENYLVIAVDQKVTILSGSFPSGTDDNNNLQEIASFDVNGEIDELLFSPSHKFVLVKSGLNFASYDLEYQTLYQPSLQCQNTQVQLKWLEDNYLWTDCDGHLIIREFDGNNITVINSLVTGQDVNLTSNGRWLYSIDKTDVGFQLQRVRMILP